MLGGVFLKLIEKSILVGFIFTILFNCLGFSSNCRGINNKILRLHILANSDSKEDQELKLKVRDKILDFSKEYLKNVTNKEKAEVLIKENLDKIKKVAEEEIARHGYNYPVSVELKETYFTTREYENFTLPAGNYDALRILIGKANGHNWWCVMFPALCIGVSKKESDQKIDSVLNSNESDIVENKCKYEFRFKTLECINNVKNWFSSWL